jgi:hypothetical protein
MIEENIELSPVQQSLADALDLAQKIDLMIAQLEKANAAIKAGTYNEDQKDAIELVIAQMKLAEAITQMEVINSANNIVENVVNRTAKSIEQAAR